MLNWGAEATRLTNNGQGAKSTQFFVKDRRARKAVNSSLQEKGKKLLVMKSTTKFYLKSRPFYYQNFG